MHPCGKQDIVTYSKKALDRILSKHSPKTEQRNGFQKAFMFAFKFGVSGSKNLDKGFYSLVITPDQRV